MIFTVLLAYLVAMPGQVPRSFKLQAVARYVSVAVIADQEMNFEISILKGDATGEVVYAKQNMNTTNQFRLMTFDIGTENVFSGDFTSIA